MDLVLLDQMSLQRDYDLLLLISSKIKATNLCTL